LLSGGQIIRKMRYEIRHHDGLVWSIDFQDANAGLVLAEVETDDPDGPIDLPPWAGAEVTLDRRVRQFAHCAVACVDTVTAGPCDLIRRAPRLPRA
jgi:CYTH domain-containing protein